MKNIVNMVVVIIIGVFIYFMAKWNGAPDWAASCTSIIVMCVEICYADLRDKLEEK